MRQDVRKTDGKRFSPKLVPSQHGWLNRLKHLMAIGAWVGYGKALLAANTGGKLIGGDGAVYR